MTKGAITREKIISKSAELFLKNGYSNTGLSTILTTCSIPKGSFYFHFKSKNDLGISVADYFSQAYTNWFTTTLNATSDWVSYVEQLTNDIHTRIDNDNFYGCPFSCFGTETAVLSEEIAAVCTDAVTSFGIIFAKAMYRKENLTATELSRGYAVLSMYEGYLVCYRITHNPQVISQMKRSLIEMEMN